MNSQAKQTVTAECRFSVCYLHKIFTLCFEIFLQAIFRQAKKGGFARISAQILLESLPKFARNLSEYRPNFARIRYLGYIYIFFGGAQCPFPLPPPRPIRLYARGRGTRRLGEIEKVFQFASTNLLVRLIDQCFYVL